MLVGTRVLFLVAVLAVTASLALLFLRVPSSRAGLLVMVAVLNFAVVTAFVQRGNAAAANTAVELGVGHSRDWIDAAVGRESDVSALSSGQARRGWEGLYPIWEGEFFNESVRRVYDLAEPMPYALPATPAQIERSTGVVRTDDGRALRAQYLLSDVSVPIAAPEVARDDGTGMVLYRVNGVVRIRSRTAP